MKKLLILIALLSTGCTTIYFDNGEGTASGAKTEKWHHNVALALVEVSEPVVLAEECQNEDWASVKTELTFINGLAATVGNVFGPLWYPKTVTVECK